jgi:hypothetical protein
MVVSGVLDVLKIRRQLRVLTDLHAIIGFKDLLRTIVEFTVPKEYAGAARSQIVLMRSREAVHPRLDQQMISLENILEAR